MLTIHLYAQIETRCVCEALCPQKQQGFKSYFQHKGQGHKVIDLDVIWKESLLECAAKYEVSIAYGSKVIETVKIDNRQTCQ